MSNWAIFTGHFSAFNYRESVWSFAGWVGGRRSDTSRSGFPRWTLLGVESYGILPFLPYLCLRPDCYVLTNVRAGVRITSHL